MADKITSIVARETDGNVQITFTIPSAIVQKAMDDTIAEFAKDVEVPGFRKGNAPLDKVKAKIPQNTLIEHSLGHLLPQALADAIKEHNVKIAIYPKYELISAEEGKDWQIRAITCELPEIKLGDYKEKLKGQKKEELVVKTLLENIKFTIPSILIEEEVTSRLSNLLARVEKLGLALESYLTSVGKTPESLRVEYEAQAKEAIALDLILSKIIEEENIKVDEKELNEALSVSTATQKPTATEDPENRRRVLESILKKRKALDFLISLS